MARRLWRSCFVGVQEKSQFGFQRTVGIVRLKRGGTSLREKAGFKGKQANGVGTQLMKREKQVTACTALLPCYYYVYTSPAGAWLSWHPRRFEWTGPFLWKTKYSLCACAITFQTHSTGNEGTARLGSGGCRVIPPIIIIIIIIIICGSFSKNDFIRPLVPCARTNCTKENMFLDSCPQKPS
jgi:hypothetical protein